MRTLFLRSPAKLNLWLEILEKREDGYHNIESIVDTVSLYDQIILKESPGRIEGSSREGSHPVDGMERIEEEGEFSASYLQKKLLKEGILIRDCTNIRGLNNSFIRVAVKNRTENQRLIEVLEKTV